MKKNLQFITFLLSAIFTQAQGTMGTANSVDGVDVTGVLLNLSSATSSNLSTSCSDDSGDDNFFKHTASTGDNTLTIAMETAGLGLGLIGSDVRYQIFKDDGYGNIDTSFTTICGNYSIVSDGGIIPITSSGGFSETITGVTAGEEYYLRVFKPGGLLSALLSTLLSGTEVTMDSTYDSTLSIENLDQAIFKSVVKKDVIELYNNTNYNEVEIYSIVGKRVSNSEIPTTNTIDITTLNKGMYVLLLKGENAIKSIKFIKQ